jgi:hypothetical protein
MNIAKPIKSGILYLLISSLHFWMEYFGYSTPERFTKAQLTTKAHTT